MNRQLKQHRLPIVLCVGADLTSNGGIASVIKSYYEQWEASACDFEYILVKTNYYKDKPRICEPFLCAYALLQLIRYMLFSNVVLVHIHTSYKWSFARKSIIVLISRAFNKKVILHLHASRFYEFFLTSNRVLAAYIAFVFQRCDMVLVLCRDWEERTKKKYADVRVEVLENPVNRRNGTVLEKSSSQELVILFMGFLIPSKGIGDMLAVAKMLSDEGLTGVKFIIAGKGEMEGEILRFIEDHDLGSSVEFAGWVDGEKKEELLSSASLFFLPSYMEGMPISILEAMCHGLPIMSTRIAGIPDIVVEGGNGYLFQPGDVKGYYRAIRKLTSNRSLAMELGRQSLEYSRRYASDVVFGRLTAFYCDVSNGRVSRH